MNFILLFKALNKYGSAHAELCRRDIPGPSSCLWPSEHCGCTAEAWCKSSGEGHRRSSTHPLGCTIGQVPLLFQMQHVPAHCMSMGLGSFAFRISTKVLMG